MKLRMILNNDDDHDHYDNDNADEQHVENDNDDNHQDQHDKQVGVPIWHGRHHWKTLEGCLSNQVSITVYLATPCRYQMSCATCLHLPFDSFNLFWWKHSVSPSATLIFSAQASYRKLCTNASSTPGFPLLFAKSRRVLDLNSSDWKKLGFRPVTEGQARWAGRILSTGWGLFVDWCRCHCHGGFHHGLLGGRKTDKKNNFKPLMHNKNNVTSPAIQEKISRCKTLRTLIYRILHLIRCDC